MLDKCYCGPVGKDSGHGLYELFAARGLCGSKSGPGQDFTKDSQPVPLNGFLLPSTPSSPCLPGRQLTILHMFCDIHHISSWINDLCWLCLTLVETWPSIMPAALTTGSCVFIIPDCRSQWVRALAQHQLSESVQLGSKWKPPCLKHSTHHRILTGLLLFWGEIRST